MKRLRWQLLIAIGGLILIAGLLSYQVPGPEVTAPQPIRGGSYAEALVGSIVRLDPVLDTYNQVDRDIDRLLYTGLVRFDSRGVPLPDLAQNWSISEDGTLYTVSLRPDAVWHDGQPVTADDVIYTFSKLQDDDYPGPADLHAMWKQVKVTRLNEHSVQFQLPEPFAPFLDYLSIGLLPEHLLRGVSARQLIDHPFNLQPVGTGPFRFDHFLVDGGTIQGVSLTAFDSFYGDKPYLDQVTFELFPDDKQELQAYVSGQVQGLGTVGADILPEVLNHPQLNSYSARLPSAGVVFLNIKNTDKAFFADKAVRQALLMAINRQSIIDRLLFGQALVAVGPILPGTWASYEQLEPTAFDPAEAGALLDADGWALPAGASVGSPEYVRAKDKQPLQFELVHADNPLHTQMAGLLQSYWAAVGVQVSLKAVTAASVLQDYLAPRQYEAVLTDIDFTRFPDPDPYPFWHDSQVETGQNYGGYEDRNTSIWLEQARTISDLTQRAELYRSFQHRFIDQVPALLLYNPVYTTAIDSQVRGVTIGPLADPSDRFASITHWYLLVRRGARPGSTPTAGG